MFDWRLNVRLNGPVVVDSGMAVAVAIFLAR
jgi:hypothetical protein